jgi:hypothetical protein
MLKMRGDGRAEVDEAASTLGQQGGAGGFEIGPGLAEGRILKIDHRNDDVAEVVEGSSWGMW